MKLTTTQELAYRLGKIREATAAMAEDHGLWFRAETAAEAYVQQELRKLCALIEAPVADVATEEQGKSRHRDLEPSSSPDPIRGLNELVSLCQWHEDAGFCVDELRSPTLWTDKPSQEGASEGEGET